MRFSQSQFYWAEVRRRTDDVWSSVVIRAEKSYHPIYSSPVERGLSWVMFYSGLHTSLSIFALSSLLPIPSLLSSVSHRLLADHNRCAVHDRSRCRNGSSRSECLPQSANGFSLFISFHHFSRPSCPVQHVEQSSRAVHDPHKLMQQIFQIRSSCTTERDAVHSQ